MNEISFRYTPIKDDIDKIERILIDSTFFNENEIDIAISLIEEKLSKTIESSYQFIFLMLKNEVIGFCCFGYIEATDISYDIYWIAIDQKYKRNGYGSLLLEKCEKMISKNHNANIYIETSSSEKYKPTRNFYEKHNYIKEAVIKNFYKENDDKIIYSKSVKQKK